MLLNKMPGFYTNSGMMVALFESEDVEIETLQTSVDNTLNQFFIELADEKTVDRWEQEVGLPKSTIPLEQRKYTIMSKLRGYGTITVARLKEVCEAYANGEVDVIEKPDTYEFDIKFVSIRGIPPNLNDLKKVIEEVKPAHLGVTYIFVYLTMGEFSSYNLTMGEIRTMNMTMAEWSTYKQ